MRTEKLLTTSLVYLARCLIRVGIDAQAFVKIAKAAYFAAGKQHCEESQLKPSLARLGRITGLSIRDLRRISREPDNEATDLVAAEPTFEGLVLEKWHQSVEYLDAQGNPRELALFGPTDSVEELVKTCGVDRDGQSVIEKLCLNGSIEKTPLGTFKPTSRRWSDPQSLAITVQTGLLKVCQVMAHNLGAPKGATWVQRTVYSDGLSEQQLLKVRRNLRSKAASFTEEIDDYFSAHADATVDTDKTQLSRVGIGLFYFEDQLGTSDPSK